MNSNSINNESIDLKLKLLHDRLCQYTSYLVQKNYSGNKTKDSESYYRDTCLTSFASCRVMPDLSTRKEFEDALFAILSSYSIELDKEIISQLSELVFLLQSPDAYDDEPSAFIYTL